MTIFANDTFTDTGGTGTPNRIFLENHTSDSAHSWTPSTIEQWLLRTDTDVVGLSTAASSGNAYHYMTLGATPPSADYQVSLDVNVLTSVDFTATGPMVRVDVAGGDSGYAATIDPNESVLRLERFDNGTRTTLGTPHSLTLGTLPTSYKVTVKAVGSSISVLLDDVEVISPVADGTYTNAGLAGMYLRTTSGEFDDFELDNFEADSITAAATEGLPSYTLHKDGAALGNLTNVRVRVTATSALNGTEYYYSATVSATAGVLPAIDLSSTAAAVNDTVTVEILTGANEGAVFEDLVEDIS